MIERCERSPTVVAAEAIAHGLKLRLSELVARAGAEAQPAIQLTYRETGLVPGLWNGPKRTAVASEANLSDAVRQLGC